MPEKQKRDSDNEPFNFRKPTFARVPKAPQSMILQTK
jgi:hypothetical protein